MSLSQNDQRFLKSLRIRPEADIVSLETAQRFVVSSREFEDAYVRAMVDRNSDRDLRGHPFFSALYYMSVSANQSLRENAVHVSNQAIDRGDKCKCGASVPHFICYV